MNKFNQEDIEDMDELIGKSDQQEPIAVDEETDLQNEVDQNEITSRDALIAELSALKNKSIPQEINEVADELEPQEVPQVQPPVIMPQADEQKQLTPQLQQNETEAPNADIYLQKLKEYEDLVKSKQKNNMYLNMIKAGQGIGQSLAGRYSGNFKADTGFIDSLQTQNQDHLKTYSELVDKYKNLSDVKGKGSSRKYQLTSVVDPSGRVVQAIFDTETGQLVPTEQTRGFANQLRVDPRTGEIIAIQPSSPDIQKQLTSPKIQLSKETEQKDVWKTFTPKQSAEVNKLQETFASETKDSRGFIDEINGTKGLVNEALTNPNTAKALGGIVAKLVEGSRLTDEDAKRYTGEAGVINSATNLAVQFSTGTITQQNADNLNRTLDLMARTINGKLKDRVLEKSKLFTNRHPDYKPEQIAPLIYGQYKQELPNIETVVLVDKQGNFYKVDKSKAQSYIDKGGYQLYKGK